MAGVTVVPREAFSDSICPLPPGGPLLSPPPPNLLSNSPSRCLAAWGPVPLSGDTDLKLKQAAPPGLLTWSTCSHLRCPYCQKSTSRAPLCPPGLLYTHPANPASMFTPPHQLLMYGTLRSSPDQPAAPGSWLLPSALLSHGIYLLPLSCVNSTLPLRPSSHASSSRKPSLAL